MPRKNGRTGKAARARKAGAAPAREKASDTARQARGAGKRAGPRTSGRAATRLATSRTRPPSARRGSSAGSRKSAPSPTLASKSGSALARATAKPSARPEAKSNSRGRREAAGPTTAPSSGYAENATRALWVASFGQRGERSGQTLATRNHDVIRRWAATRGAVPATVPGTERDGRPGVLRFDFPDIGGRRLRAVDWDEWFETFDARRLVFLFQEPVKRGSPGGFFRLDGPEREER